MNKIFALSIIFSFFAFPVFAAQNQIQDFSQMSDEEIKKQLEDLISSLDVQSLDTSVIQSVQNQQRQGSSDTEGDNQSQQVQNKDQSQTQTQLKNEGENQQNQIQKAEEVINIQIEEKVNQVQERMREKEQEMSQNIQSLNAVQKEVYQNQNRIMVSTDALKNISELIEEVGSEISEIAEEIEISVQNTVQAEERITDRNRIVRFFAGGDAEAASQINQEVSINKERIQQLKELKENSDYQEEAKELINQQILLIEEEQTRLENLAQTELQFKNIFQRIFEWINF